MDRYLHVERTGFDSILEPFGTAVALQPQEVNDLCLTEDLTNATHPVHANHEPHPFGTF